MIRIKPIPRFPGYCITKDGRVWSAPKRGSSKQGMWLRPSAVDCGHLYVVLYQKGIGTTKTVHRLVLETYVGPCPDGMECRHLDGNPKNNNLDNLKWGTKSENQQDAVRHGTAPCLFLNNRGDRHGRSKLTKQDIRMIIYMYRTGLFLQKEIASIYKVSRQHIGGILSKRFWKHLWAV